MIQTAEEFIQLRTSEDPDEYKRAIHDEAPLEVWRAVIKKDQDMKYWVLQNKTIPKEIIEELAGDSSEKVRAAVARKRRAPAEVLRRLAHDPHESVRLAVATNQKASRSILESMLNDDWERVVEAVRLRLGTE